MRADFRLSVKFKRFLRALIGVSVAYAVAAQGLLIALGGFPPVAQAHDDASGFELCLHDSQNAPAQSPANTPDQSGCTHCLFCVAGAHQALISGAPTAFHRVDVAVVETSWSPDISRQPLIPAHSIANPRGPPPRG
jgi:hypothetical protein